jgi:hypothetical protein
MRLFYPPKADIGQVGDENFELASWDIVVIPHEAAFAFDRGKIRAQLLRPDREKPILASSQE